MGGLKASTRFFGKHEDELVASFHSRGFFSGHFYSALLDEAAIWSEDVLTQIIEEFPDGHLNKADLFLVLAECVSNAALHGRARAFGLCARKRKGVLLISFFQNPPMVESVATVISLLNRCSLPNCVCETPGGLGFPILAKLAKKITLSTDRSRLRLWFR